VQDGEGSTNRYLSEPRIIEEFLTGIEPKYNASVDQLRRGEIDREAVYVIAGFAAYVASCSPGAMRINSGPLRGSLEATMNVLDKRGTLPRAPVSLGGKTASELVAEGKIKHIIDEKYPQAIGITNVLHHVGSYGNSCWEVARPRGLNRGGIATAYRSGEVGPSLGAMAGATTIEFNSWVSKPSRVLRRPPHRLAKHVYSDSESPPHWHDQLALQPALSRSLAFGVC
jgi:hypothetical protein